MVADLPGGRSWVVDLADLDGIDAFAARADAEMGGVDVLVNNAGIPKRRRTTTMTADDAESVMAMNYFSPVRLTLALLPRMIERGRGDIVNVSSMGVHLVAFGVGAYSASKATLELFTESLYVELPGTGVRAHLVIPGTTITEFSTPREGNDPPLPPGPTAATPEEVAAAIVASVDSDQFVSYATTRDADSSATKAADPNAFLASSATPSPASAGVNPESKSTGVQRDVADVVDAHVAPTEAPLAVDLLELVAVVAVDDRPQRLVTRLLEHRVVRTARAGESVVGDVDDGVGDHVLGERRAVVVLACRVVVHRGDGVGPLRLLVGGVGGDHRVGEVLADALVVAGVDQLGVAVQQVGDRDHVPEFRSSSWPLPSEQHHVGEQRTGAAAGAHRDLGALDLHGDARAAELLDAADHPLEQSARSRRRG